MIAFAPKPRVARRISCVGCGKCADGDDGENDLPTGWRLLVAVPPLPVCSESCADFIVVGKRRDR